MARSSSRRHRGRALVFETADELRAHIDDDDLDVDADTVLVLKNAGPRGYPGMPEVGTMALPKKLLAQGVTDMVRISDARMSGTAFGTVVLHVAPESALGGPLALVKTGDMIVLDTAARKLELDVPAEELERRRKAFVPPPPAYERGYGKLYIDHVTQANEGVDFDFLRGKSGTPPSKLSF
jgi:L-arabonate dehydrase